MSEPVFMMRSCVRQGSARLFGEAAVLRYCWLGTAQPLLLVRDPRNPVDGSAVALRDLNNQPVGYVAREDAGTVFAMLERGHTLMCRTEGPCACVSRDIVIWEDGEEVEQQLHRRRVLGKSRAREMV